MMDMIKSAASPHEGAVPSVVRYFPALPVCGGNEAANSLQTILVDPIVTVPEVELTYVLPVFNVPD